MATKKTGPMCVVTINYHEYIMPAAAGMKVVQLMTGAMQVDSHYDNGRAYELRRDEPVTVEYASVVPSQIRARRREKEPAPNVLAIEGRSTRLLGNDR